MLNSRSHLLDGNHECSGIGIFSLKKVYTNRGNLVEKDD